MESWKERLVNETLELNEKFLKLEKFLRSTESNSLDQGDYQLLNAQRGAMEAYLSILVMRIMKHNIMLPYTINLDKRP